ncbi:MAG TPA: hypothetical protein VE178_05615 [Silvibacterium sp.]|nr:hypothetical protein [Silvibacterium sp.]
MKLNRIFAAATMLSLAVGISPVLAQGGDTAATQAVITVTGKNNESPAPLRQQDLKVQVAGKSAPITDLVPLRGDRAGLDLVILIDGSARTSLGTQLGDIQGFVKSLPPTTAVGIAYMANGRAVFSGPLTTDKAKALQALRLPAGSPGSSASPYFCLSDLAKHWPSTDRDNRREVVMITDGVDPYNLRFDPENPYLQTAINDSIRAGLIVDSIYWHDQGRYDQGLYQNNAGQSLLNLVSQATGGKSYWQGLGNPVSFSPFFEDLGRRLQNQYELGFDVPAKSKAQIVSLKVKLTMPDTKIDAPERVELVPAGVARQ